jgi:hypothetical protein
MELRDIEIFLTLAEELHFGRTAERLHVSQARVSTRPSADKNGASAWPCSIAPAGAWA